MKKHFAIAIFGATSALFGGEDAKGKWTLVEKINIEYQWRLPANNSCDVTFRDVQKSGKTILSVYTRYRPHKAQKAAIENRKDQVTLDSQRDGIVHIYGCEDVMSVEIEQVRRN